MRTTSSVLFTIALGAAACRGGGGGPDGPGGGDAPPNPDDTSIYDIQNPDMRVAEGTNLTIKGVVVTAIDTYGERADGTRKGNIWIEEPAGGAYSGVLVFGAPADVVATLHVGDVIDLAGAAKTEFVLTNIPMPDMTGRKTTELQPGDSGTIAITVVSTGGAPPAPELVDPIAIAQLDDTGTRPTARDNEFEKWEGVLIRVENVSQTSTISLVSGEANFQRFKITGGYEVDTSMAPFPSGAAIDNCYASITGIGDYFFSWKLEPRETAAIETGGTGCPAPEEGDALCGNGMDDDYDGFADCVDFSCQDTSAACVTDTTVTDIQMGSVTGVVNLTNVFVSGVTFNRKHLYVQDALAGAPYNGVYVYRGGSATVLPAEIVAGATVNISGTVQEFMPTGTTTTVTEITNPTVTFVAAPTGLPTPATTDIATLNDATAGEPYEGVYVKVANVSVSNVVGMGQDFYFTLNHGTDSIIADDDIYRHTPTDGDCYASVSAIFGFNTFTTPIAPHVNLLPTLATDIVPGGTCN